MYATHISKHLNSVSLYVRVCQIDVQGVHKCALLASVLKSGRVNCQVVKIGDMKPILLLPNYLIGIKLKKN